MENDRLKIKEKKFSSKEFKAFYTESGDFLRPTYEEESGVLGYLNSICICNPKYTDEHPNFFDGEVLAHIKYFKRDIKEQLGEGPFEYREHVTIRWQPGDKEPSLLIKILTDRFKLKED